MIELNKQIKSPHENVSKMPLFGQVDNFGSISGQNYGSLYHRTYSKGFFNFEAWCDVMISVKFLKRYLLCQMENFDSIVAQKIVQIQDLW